ncbi:hypothetical protein GCM10010400_76510 [Streptomyces aculeolatus]|uniref:hypothetical protein n=1 Tax=Streptomyces aculeolatus TaxID=270689 RepID=UPI001CEDAB69|nr:hypothetical protein [Streptomyces aculeolatus]
MAADPLRFLDQLEHDWHAAQSAAPDRDRRLDPLLDAALIHLAVQSGVHPEEARRQVAAARRALDDRP